MEGIFLVPFVVVVLSLYIDHLFFGCGFSARLLGYGNSSCGKTLWRILLLIGMRLFLLALRIGGVVAWVPFYVSW